MRKHMKRITSYLLAIIIFLSDIPIVVNAEEGVDIDSQSVETVVDASESEIEETEDNPEEAEIISELTEKRDETTKYFAMSDGTTKACIYPQNIHYLDEGEYKEIDNTLVEHNEEGKTYYKNKKNNFSVKIPENYADDYIEFSDENGYVKFKLKGATNKKLEKREKEQTKKNKDKTLVDNVNDKAIFKSVKGNVDIEYDVTGNKLKETIVLYKKTKNSFVFDVKTSAHRAILNNDNSVSFWDAEGNELYTIESPYMVDSAGEYSNDIKTTLLGLGDSYTITYKPNYEWLSAKERVYPVKIDPTMFQAIYKETVADTYVTNAQTASDTRGYWDVMNIGKRHTTTGGEQIVLRGLIKFDIPSEIGSNDCIVDAKLDLVHCNYTDYVSNNGIQIDLHELTQSFSEGDAWWGNQPTYDPNITDYAIVNTGKVFSGTSLSYDSYNLTRLVSKWHNGETNHGIILKLHDDSSNVSTRQQVYYFAKQSTYYGTVSKFVEITYRNAVGLEDYWSYTTQDFGQYGAGYVNNYNGNLVYVHEDTSFNSLINGFTLSHVYNTNLTTHNYLVNNTTGYYGTGWRLNLVQTLVPISVTGNSSVKYVYTDGDGTQHYFVETSDGTIVDEDGLGYTYTDISEGGLTRQLTNKNGTVLKFDQWSYLRHIIDSNGNMINLNYSTIPYVDNYLSSITTSSGGYFGLNYDSNYNLISIIDNANRTINYKYSSGNLTEINYPDGTVLKFQYNSNTHWLTGVVSPDNSRIQYDHYSFNGKVLCAKFYGTNGAASTNTSFQYLQNQTCVINSDNRSITYQFDMWGRVTCMYDDKHNIYSQTYNSTINDGNGILKNNKLKYKSNGSVYVNNLLMNGVFTNGMTGWTPYQENAVISVVSNIGLLTSNSIKIESSGNTKEVIAQTPSVSSERTFTYSGYIKTENVQSLTHGAGLEVVVAGSNNTKQYLSEMILGNTDSEINNGFQRVSISFTLEDGESIVQVSAGLFHGSGTVYIDSLQLEEGNTANQINLIDNSSFERNSGFSNTPPNEYSVYGLGCTNNFTATDGEWNYWIPGDVGATKYINQTILQSGKKGDTYSFGMWAKTYAVPNGHDGSSLRFACGFEADDGTVDWKNICFNNYVQDWQFASDINIADHDYNKIYLFVCLDHNANGTYFDSLFLYKDSAQSYTYDENGNVLTTESYAKQQTQYEYSDNNPYRLITPEGTSYEYYYDSNKNVVLSRSGEGLQQNNEYDSSGNVISTALSSNCYATSITHDKVYYIRNKLSGKYIDISINNVQQNSFTGDITQQWKVVSNNNGTISLVNQSDTSNGYMTVSNCQNTDGQNVQTYIPYGNNDFLLKAESFKIEPASKFTYKIMTCASDYLSCIEVGGNNTEDGGNINQWTYVGTDTQQWYFEPVEQSDEIQIEDGSVYMFRARHSGKYIDIRGGCNDTGTLVQQYEYNYTNAQKYILNQYEDTDYYFFTTCIDNTKKLEISSEVNSAGYKYLYLSDNTVTDNKLFKFEYNTSQQGLYIVPKVDETLALDVIDSSLLNSVELIFTPKEDKNNRIFIAEKISDSITGSATYQDNGNYPHTVTDARGHTTTYTYDTSRGLQTGVTDAKGTTTTYAYNVLNDRLELVTSGNSTVSYQYETNGALKNITTPSESIYNFFYDVFGRTSRIAIGNTTLSETQYKNNASSLVSRFDYGNGAYKTYEYDNQDRLISEGANGATTRTYIYDKQGNTAQTKDHLTNVTTTYTHDLIGRISRIKASDGQTSNFVYDTYNRLSLSKWSKGDTTLSSGYVYGDNSVENQKTGLIYGVKLNGIQQLGYEYDELARLQRRLLYTTTPFVTEYTYLEGASANTTTTLVKTVKNGNDILEYTYDEIGNITSVSKNGTIIEQYTYDALSQLISATYGGNTYMYSYDNGGNLTEIKKNGETIKTYTYSNSEWTDQLTGYNGETITYDEVGNPLIYRNGINFTWQNGRQLAGITQNGSPLATYTYNADGLRNTKTVNGITTEYYWQNGTLYGQKTGDESIFYLYDENGSAYGFIYKNLTEQSHYYYEFNLQGDIIGIIDSTGTKVVEYTYGAWGDLISITGTLADTIGQKNPLRYRGYYYDAETGFYYVSSRYYDPEIGRFLNADGQIANVGGDILGYNMFAYCMNNPVNMSDPTGNWPKWATKLAVAVAVVATVAVVAAVTVATAGAGTAIAAVAVGAAKGAAIGLAVGAATGAASGAISHRVSTGSWQGAGEAALNGMGNGALTGAIGGAITGGLTGGLSYNSTASTSTAGNGFNTFRQLKNNIGSPGVGNEWHHIVEQSQIAKSGFSPQMIQNTNNIMAVSKSTHRAISGYYSSIQPFTNGMIVRNWLAGQSFSAQYQFGLDVIKLFM